MRKRWAARACTPRQRRGALSWRRTMRLACDLIRQQFRQMPAPRGDADRARAREAEPRVSTMCCRPIIGCRTTSKISRRASWMRDEFLEFQPEYAPELLCATARLNGRHDWRDRESARISEDAEGPRIGGIVYTESARKVAYFVENAERHGCRCSMCRTFRDSWWAWKRRARASFARARRWWRAMACATVPKIVLTLNHASGAGYYAMAGQGFDPNFTFSWPTARIGVMEGDSAVQAMLRSGAGEAEVSRARQCRRNWKRRSRRRGPITIAGWMRSMRRREGTAMRDD